MERIASFSVDHTKLKKGMYLSRTDFDDIYTYDIRMKVPNAGDYLEINAVHTLEHLIATYARNSRFGNYIVYAGPMGCMTGVYFITKGLPHEDAITLTQEIMDFVAAYEDAIPGTSEPECGNYLAHDLAGARAIAADMAQVLKDWTVADLEYSHYLD